VASISRVPKYAQKISSVDKKVDKAGHRFESDYRLHSNRGFPQKTASLLGPLLRFWDTNFALDRTNFALDRVTDFLIQRDFFA
jgi:hypothetical protein